MISVALPVRSRFILLAGLPGTGESTLGKALAGSLASAVILNKDDIRAAMFPGDAIDYSDAQNDLAMGALLASAGYLCSQPTVARYLLIDGRTFARARHIEQVIQAAKNYHAAWSILHLWCPDELAMTRLAASQPGHPAHNRNPALYRSLQQSFETIRQPHLLLDTSVSVAQSVQTALAYLGV